MDLERLSLVREVLESSGWLERTRAFAAALRSSARDRDSLMLVGTPEEEPWHFAAHLTDEARLSGAPQLAPTLVRWRPPPGAPPHLAVGLERLEAARRGESLLVVAPGSAPASLLERVADARRAGATVLAMDSGDHELEGLAHEALTLTASGLAVPTGVGQLLAPAPLPTSAGGLTLPFDLAEHLVSLAAGERPVTTPRRPLRDRLARTLDRITGPASDPSGRGWPRG